MSNFDNLREAYPDDRSLVSALNYIEARLVDAIRPHQDPQDQVLLSNNLPGEQREQNQSRKYESTFVHTRSTKS